MHITDYMHLIGFKEFPMRVYLQFLITKLMISRDVRYILCPFFKHKFNR
jgi:hypothetical protein